MTSTPTLLQELCGSASIAIWEGDDFGPCFHALFINFLSLAFFMVYVTLEIGLVLSSNTAFVKGYQRVDRQVTINTAQEDSVDELFSQLVKERSGYDIPKFFILVLLLLLNGLQFLYSRDSTDPYHFFPLFITALTISVMAIGNLYILVNPESYLAHRIRLLLRQFVVLFLLLSVVDFRSSLVVNDYNLHSYPVKLVGSQLLLSIVVFILVALTRSFQQILSPDGIPYTKEYGASWYETITISWMNDVLSAGYKNALNEKSLWDLVPRDKAENVLRLYEQLYTNSLLKSILRTCRKEFIEHAFYSFVSAGLKFLSPFLMGCILNYIQYPETRGSIWWAYFYAIALPLSSMVESAFKQQASILGKRLAVQATAIITSEIYRKSLRRSMLTSTNTPSVEPEEDKKPAEDERNGAGEVINLLEIDQGNISTTLTVLYEIYSMPIMFLVSVIALSQYMGLSLLFAILGMVLFYPLMGIIIPRYIAYQKELLRSTDKRINIINEVLQGIRLVKLFAWEAPMRSRIEQVRKKELEHLKDLLLVMLASMILSLLNPVMAILFMFGAYTRIFNNELDAATLFTTMAWINLLRMPVESLPELISWLGQCKVSLNRINSYLESEEIEEGSIGDTRIGFKNAEFQWSFSDSENGFRLKGLDFNFPLGEMTVIAGPTGSGKTSLLLALLGEMPLVKGRVLLPRRFGDESIPVHVDQIAYVSQTAWLQNLSIRDNILFGKAFDPVRYERTIQCCALSPDFAMLEAGDSTEIGEKGVTLSGGQKQRVALARAVYSDAKHLILDDCLSAVDAHTAKKLYENCLLGELMNGRTRILVTHHVALCLPGSTYFVQLNQGQVVLHGFTKELLQSGQLESAEESGILTQLSRAATLPKEEPKDEAANKTSGKLTEEEARAVGNVEYSVYDLYIKASGGYLWWIWVIIAFIIAQFWSTFQTYWLRIWSSQYETENEVNINYYLGVYFALALVTAIFTGFRFYVLIQGSLRASQNLHSRLIDRIIHAKVRFFDITPLGRIMNRFSQDIKSVDQQISIILLIVLLAFMELASILAVITFVTPAFIFPGLILAVIFTFIMKFYLMGSRDLKRLESVSKSPLLTHIGETLNGICTIRAFGAEDRFIHKNYQLIDGFNRPSYLLAAAKRWLSWRIDIASATVSLFASLLIILSLASMDAGLAGFSLVYAAKFTGVVFAFMGTLSELELIMNSAERINEYLNIDQEPPAIISSFRTPTTWPSNGEIKVENITVSYSEDKAPVLKQVSFHIKPGTRVGIVGRTGAGKSTLANAFFRFIEVSEGRILIDGIDISRIGLQDLRGHLTIIPQDAVLFTGTIRTNLDPFDQFDDETIWTALRRSHLVGDDEETTLPEGLDTQVTEGGSNFSQGQRQLLAMSRALLRSSKVIIMDEATASVDFDTDEKIQKTIREAFTSSTLLCIAHRIRTIIDYDLVVVMDAGTVAEIDSPWNLLQLSKGGIFRSMCERSGEFTELWEMAMKKKSEN